MISKIECPTEEPKVHQELSVLNEARLVLTGPKYLHQLIASSNSDAVAIDYLQADDTRCQISYRELRRYVNSLVKALRKHITSGDRQPIIPIVMSQCPELYISYLAILEAGAGFCPIMPDVPSERLKFVVGDVEADLVLSTDEHEQYLKTVLPCSKILAVSLQGLLAQMSSQDGSIPTSNSISVCRPDDVAYVMYTSGSTGLPKGVRIPHAAVTQSLLAHDEHIPPFKRFLQFAAPSFDVSIFEIFFPLLRGATLVCCERERMLADLPGIINQLHVDAAELTPTVAGTLLKTRAAAPKLHILLTIGEMLTKQVIQEFGGSQTRESILYAMYGPTEAAIHCTLAPRLSATSSVKNIGAPLSTVTAFILSEAASDGRVEILPFGGTGELAVAGQLASGYLNRPEQTSIAFIDLPGYGLIYRTGDRAMMLRDNTIQILGRMSAGQVKLRGQRVELGEIEETVCKAPGVELAIASVIDDNLVVFCSGGLETKLSAVKATCKAWLPRYMRPNDIVILTENIPRLPSGKVDRRKLEEAYSARQQQPDHVEMGEWNEVKRQLTLAIEAELGSPINPGTSLWSSGLDSLKAITITAGLRSYLPHITVAMLLQSDTVTEIASKVEAVAAFEPRPGFDDHEVKTDVWQGIEDNLRTEIGLQHSCGQIETISSCHSMQIAMLTETLSNPELNFNTIELHYTADIEEADLQHAFKEVAARNPVLRSGFVQTEYAEIPFVQIVWDHLSLSNELTLLHPFQFQPDTTGQKALIRIHHALYDGWSWDLIMSDVDRCLSKISLPTRPQYHSLIDFDRRQNSMHYDRDKEYWHSVLDGALPCQMPNLLTIRNAARSRRSCQKVLNSESRKWSDLARASRIGRQTILQTAVILLVSAYCDTLDVICGVVSSGRERALAEIDQVIGPCLLTYPMRVNIASVETISDLLHYIQRLNLEQMDHSSLGLADICRAARLSTSQRLFDTLCVWQEGPENSIENQRVVKTGATSDGLDYSFILEAGPADSGTWAKLTFDTTRVPPKHAELFLDQIDQIISTIISSPRSKLSNVWTQLDPRNLSVSNTDLKSFDGPYDLVATIRKLSKENPDRIAVEFVTGFDPSTSAYESSCLSYERLYTRSMVAAKHLVSSQHIRPNDLICIILEKSPQLYIMILAAIIAGAGYMCIDPKLPDLRISHILHEAECTVTLTDQPDRLRDLVKNRSALVRPDELASDTDARFPVSIEVEGDALAYAVFTSGSTGTPKGVLITRKNLASNIDHLSKVYPYHPSGDKLLQSCSQAFDVSVFEIFWTWHLGLTLCSATNDVLYQDIEGFIRTLEITHLSMTPSVAALVDPHNVASVKVLVTAGEPMNSKVLESWAGKGLYQGYGPSETTNICNVRARVSKDDFYNNVGPAFDNTSLFICSKQPRSNAKQHDKKCDPPELDFIPLPRGAIGEIWIGGDQVGRGYIDPQLTARSWVDHELYGRLYRSGDIGRLLADDSLVILGREDNQIKLRGLRIELGEINSVLVNQSTVRDAATLVVDRNGRQRLMSFCVCDLVEKADDRMKNVKDIYQWLEEHLADYMLPDAVILVDSIPLTRQGKVDSRQLKALFEDLDPHELLLYSRGSKDRADKSQLTDTETQVANILSGIIGVPPEHITRNTSFYSLGIDSIKSISFAQQLHKRGFLGVDVSTILKNPSIGRLITQLQTPQASAHGCLDDTLNSIFEATWRNNIHAQYEQHGFKVERIMPCTPLQEIMLSTASSDAYKNHLKWKLHSNIQDIQCAWAAMVVRHELLRTAFLATENPERSYAQVVLKNFELAWSDNTNESSNRHDLALPPYKFQVWRGEGDSKLSLSLSIHHAMYDAEAMSVLLHDVEEIVHGRELPPAPMFASYIDHMIRMDTKQTDSFWKLHMEGVTPSRMGSLFTTTKATSNATEMETVHMTSEMKLHELEDYAKSNSTTILTLMQTTVARLLSLYLDSKDVCFGNVFSGRTLPIPDVSRIVGPCFNTLPIRITLDEHLAVRDLEIKIQQLNVDMMPFQPTSLRRIQRQYSPDGKALFDVLLLLQQGDFVLDETIWTLEEDDGDMSFPFIIEIVPNSSSDLIHHKLHFQSCDASTATVMLQHFDVLLRHTAKYAQAVALNFEMIEGPLPMTPRPVPSESNPTCSILKRDLTSIEYDVCHVLKDLSGQEIMPVFPTTTIYKFGLDSISAVQLASRLRERGYAIKVADILEGPTIEEIATLCQSQNGHQFEPADVNVLKLFDDKFRTQVEQNLMYPMQQIEDVLPCTPSQSGMLSQFISSQGALYYNRIRLTLDKNVDPDRLKKAWQKVSRVHDVLRTGFVELDSANCPFAMVIFKADTHDISWRYADSNGIDAAERGKRILRDLAKPPWEIVTSSSNECAVLDLWMLHTLYDAKSINQILMDVAVVYKGHDIVQEMPVRSIVSQILASSQDSELARQFWTEVGHDLQPTKFPDMSIYRQPPACLTSISIDSRFSMPKIQSQCSHHGVSLQTICQAVWARILAAYCGQDLVSFGVILGGRMFEQPQFNEAVFPCINTVPFAIDAVKGDHELLTAISRRNAGLIRYQHIPLTKIKHWNGITTDLFDTVLVLQKFEGSKAKSDFWEITEDEASGEYTASLEILPSREACSLQLTYRPDLIPDGQAKWLLKEFDEIMGSLLQIGKDPATEIGNAIFSMLPAKEERLSTKVAFLHELLEDTAQRCPTKTALEFAFSIEGTHIEKRSWTYLELDSRGNQIANILTQRGAEVGELVAVCFDKCPEASFAILGVLKAGCAYVAIDPAAPEARRNFILSDASCRYVLTTSHLAQLFKGISIDLILADDQHELASMHSGKPKIRGELTGEHNAYCLYTSGTTGTPKGCLISHDSAVQAMLSFSRIFKGRWTEDSCWLQFASFHFDVSVLEQYWSWSVGICVTSAPRDLLFEDLPGNIKKLGITHLDLTPSLAKLLTPETVPGLCDGIFIVGGEQIQQEVLDIWGSVGCLYNFYGPSEVTIGCTVHPKVPKNARPSNIGQQWDNVGSFVLDPESQKPVIRGGVGELCLSGVLVGMGYLNRSELTSTKFIKLDEYKTRVYRTGDLVRLLHDDSFDFLGRIDGQVKLRGQRLEVGEINHVISQSAKQIQDVSTVVLKYPQHDKEQLAAFYSTSSSRQIGDVQPKVLTGEEAMHLTDIIRRACNNKLPTYMVPTYFIGLDFMPLSPNNKIDNKILSSIYDQSTISEIPTGKNVDAEVGRDLHEIIRRLTHSLAPYLDIEESSVQPQSKLFELGLDSISVIGLSRILKRAGFQRADVSTIMNNSVVLDLARAIKDDSPNGKLSNSLESVKAEIACFTQRHDVSVADYLKMELEDIEIIVPATPLQQGMISKVLNSNTTNVPYFASFTYNLLAGISTRKLQSAWQEVTHRLGMLRTRFVPTEDGYVQVVVKNPKILSLCLTGEIDGHNVEQSFREWVETARTFGSSLPWQVCFTEGKTSTSMTIFLFHGLYDGVSLPLLLGLVKQEYHAQSSPEDSIIQFHEVLAYGPLAKMEGEERFWNQELTHISPLYIATESSEPQEIIKLSESVSYPVITQLCHDLNVTTPAIFHAAWLYALFLRYGINPTIGLVMSGRSIEFEGASTVIGPMFNTIPCSISKLPSQPTMHDLVRACHKFNMRTIPYQHSSLTNIAKWLGQNPRESLFDSLFVFQKIYTTNSPDLDDIWTQDDSAGSIDYPLNLEIEEIDGTGDFHITMLATQSNNLSKSDTTSLLNSLKQSILHLVEGENISLSETFATAVQKPVLQSSAKDLAQVRNVGSSSRQWTETTTMIRNELVQLTGEDHTTMGLESPSIFELGLDSIDALKLVARLKKKGLIIAVSALMQNPTIEGIATNCQKKRLFNRPIIKDASVQSRQKAWHQVIVDQGLQIEQNTPILPVTPMQEALLLNHSIYYHVFQYDIHKDTNITKLSNAIAHLVRTEPILRTRFVPVEDASIGETFLQVIQHCEDLRSRLLNLDNEQQLTDVTQHMKEEARHQGISGQYPRVTTAKIKGGRSFLLIGLPHAMYDGWSLGLLHSQLKSLYHDNIQPRTSLKLLTSYLNKVSEQSTNKASKQFWREALQGASTTLYNLKPIDAERTAGILDRPSRLASKSISEMCKRVGITMQSLGLACWASLLAHNTKKLDVAHGLVLFGRTTEGADLLVFPTFNTVIFRTVLDDKTQTSEYLEQVHKNSHGVFEHQHFPLKKSLRYLNDSNKESFNTLFTFQTTITGDNQRQPLYHEHATNTTAVDPPYAVNIEMTEKDGRVWWTCAVQDNIASMSEIEGIIEQLDHIMAYFAANLSGPVITSHNDEIIICGLEPIKLNSVEHSSVTNGHSDDNILTNPIEAWNDIELKVRSILAQLSHISDHDQIKKTTSIFQLGLDSISAIKISGQLRKQGITLPVSEIIRAQTVERISQAAEKQNQPSSRTGLQTLSRYDNKISKQVSQVLGIPEKDIESILPAAAGQVYMLDAWKASQGRLFYADFWLEATKIIKQDFDRAFHKLTTLVPAFRTTFVEIANSTTTTYAVTIKLKREPLEIRFPWSLKSIESGNKVLAKLHIHHALYDAVGLHVMVDSLTRLCRNPDVELDIKTDFAPYLQLTRNMGSASISTRKEFWISYLADQDQDQADQVHQHLSGTFSSSRTENFLPSLTPFNALQPALKKFGISIQTLFFAAYARIHAELLQTARKTEQKSISTPNNVILGIYMANRFLNVENIDSLVAPTFNILPIKITVAENVSLIETAKQIQHDLQEISRAEHCGASLRDIHAWTGLKLDAYMNFLRLPDDTTTDEQEDSDTSGIKVTHAEGQSLYDAQSSMHHEVEAAFISNATGNNHIIDGDGNDNSKSKDHPPPKANSPYALENTDQQIHVPSQMSPPGDVHGYIIPAIDVEARVMPNGQLAMGIFAPTDMLNTNEVDEIMHKVKLLINSII